MGNALKVSVVMITYGHERFIEEAINGVLMQQTDFEVELIIANDCSIDGTDAVVEKILKNHPKASWIDYTKHKINLGMMPNFVWAIEQCKGRYIALCEGDDYWTDPLKLQKQVDFLEANENYGLVHTNTTNLNQRTQKLSDRVLGLETGKELAPKDLFYAILNSQYIVATLTALFRAELLQHVSLPLDFKMGDVPLWLQLTQVTKFKFLNDITSVYRQAYDSATRPQNILNKFLFDISASEMRIFFSKKFDFTVTEFVLNNYRKRVFEYKVLTSNSIEPRYYNFFSSEELIYLSKSGNIFQKIKSKTLLIFKFRKHYAVVLWIKTQNRIKLF